MALELGGFVIGAASLLAGFKGAIDSFVFLSDVFRGFDDASFHTAKLEIEKQRLQIWCVFFGTDEDSDCEKLLDQPEAIQSLVVYIFEEFVDATRNLDKMRTKYGLELVKPGIELQSANAKTVRMSELLADLAARQTEKSSKLKWWKKGFPWALDLARRVVPRIDLPVFPQGLPSFLVPGHGPEYLQTYQQSAQEVLAMCATAKSIKMKATVISNVPEVKFDQLEFHGAGVRLADGPRRDLALFRHQQSSPVVQVVIVDWNQPNDSLTPDERREAQRRVKTLCLVENPAYARDHPGHKEQGFVFGYPSQDSGKPESLLASFKSLQHVPAGDRFRLAQSLASGLLLLHSSNWLHKNICSDNVVVFRSTNSQLTKDTSYIASPYFTGFSYARPDAPGEASMERPETSSLDFYRRPGSENGSSRYNDIYSLGVVLFEIGLWRSAESACSKGNPKTKTEVLKFPNHNCGIRKKLCSRMGSVYAAVVHRCLNSDFNVHEHSQDDGELIKMF
ncbi:hypothetical protein EDB80DRAFT_872214 [Ilyonectria destructans]|nr:hypothetical protein EDB80DRAFT_872214 [Ilyonectria destructans]